VTFPLPWSLTYVLLQPSGAQTLTVTGDSVRRSLARDAVRAEARPAEPPFWWDSLSVCSTDTAPEEQHLTASRIVYPRDDEVARGLAERLVALGGSGTSLRAVGLGPADLAAALRDGTERGFVIAAPRESLAPCRDAAWPTNTSIQPLIDTRARAIVRQGSPALTVDWDGTVRVLHHVGNDFGSGDVVVWLTPLTQGAPVAPGPTARLMQKNKKFIPHVVAVTQGTEIEFPNQDLFFHNVFSIHQGKTVDLGLYESGAARKVRFSQPGVSP